MYIKLPFRILGIKYQKSVNIVLNLGTLEDICKDAKIEFHELGDYIKSDGITFSRLLLYHGYMASCKYDRKRPKYDMSDAILWVNEITAIEQVKIYDLIKDMFDTIKTTNKANSKKKA